MRITCKTCRRLGESLCGREKCAFKKRPYAPGRLDSERKHRSNLSEYGEQLRAKQKLRLSYGLMEGQFGGYVKKALATKKSSKEEVGMTPELALYTILESRLDNVVYRMGLAHTRALARQLVSHGHVLVNGKRVSIASAQVRIGDVVSVRGGSKGSKVFEGASSRLESASNYWLTTNPEALSVTVKAYPREVEPGYDFQKVFEYYSR